MQDKNLLETNLYEFKGDILIVGSCLKNLFPEAYEKLAKKKDQIYSVCLENTHINMIITKLSAALGKNQIKSITFASVDNSPHCIQLHYIENEIRRVYNIKIPVNHYVVKNNLGVLISDKTIRLSKSLTEIEKTF